MNKSRNESSIHSHRRRWRSSMSAVILTLFLLCCSVVCNADTTTAEQQCIVDSEGQCHNKDDTTAAEELVKAASAAGVAAVTSDEGAEELDLVWFKGTADQIGSYIKCPWDTDEDEHTSLTRTYIEDDWKLFNDVYHKVVPRERSSLPSQFTKNGYHVPMEIKLGDLGRGIFATEEIAKGTLIWKVYEYGRISDRPGIPRLFAPLASTTRVRRANVGLCSYH